MSNELKKKLETMLAKLNDYEAIQKSPNPFSVTVTSPTIDEVKLFLSYSQLFLEKEIDLFSMLDALSVKLTGVSLKSQNPAKDKKEEKSETKNESKPQSAQKPDKAKKTPQDSISVKKGTLVPVDQVTSQSIASQIVKVICCAGIESNNPKVKKLGPNFLAKVLSDEGEMVKVQIVEKNFDPFIFSLPREDVELV